MNFPHLPIKINTYSLFNKKTTPFILSLLGVIGDLFTTNIGLSRGFIETHLNYSPIFAIIIFWSSILILQFTLPKRKVWYLSIIIISLFSFLGLVNNSFVLLGIFPGLVI
jgi:glucan phosphoethanolaminetransferase (alkaline phosphatase superfamily)